MNKEIEKKNENDIFKEKLIKKTPEKTRYFNAEMNRV